MAMLDDYIKREFNTTPISMVEFAESDEYCNKSLYPRQRVLLKLIFLEEMEGWEEDILDDWISGGADNDVFLSPLIRERRDFLRERNYRHFGQVNLVGGRRSSKGYVSSFVAARKMYDTFLLGDPGKYYGIDPDKEIYYGAIAASLEQAKKFQFSDIVSTVTRCNALKDHLGKIQEEGFRVHTPADLEYVKHLKKQGHQIARDWAKLRVIPLAANADTIRGSTSMFLIFDEMAFMLPGESRSSADECFRAAEPALAQFGKDGMIMCNSSPYTKIGRFYDEVKNGHSVENGLPEYPQMLSFQFPSWELYKDYEKDPNRRFKSAIMVSPDWPDEVLAERDIEKRDSERLKEKANPETYRVERRGQWAEVIDAYLDPTVVDKAFAPVYMDRVIKEQKEGTYRFTYVGHCDPSSTTAGFGFAMGHVEEFPDPNFPDGTARHVVFDFVKRWNPQDFPGGTIDYIKVVSEISHTIDLFRPYEVSFDQWNSTAPIQWLRKELRYKSIDRTRVFEVTGTRKANWNKWETLKTAMNLGLVHLPDDCIDSEYAKQELKFLKEENGRVEKQSLGPVQTKDMADCIREVVYKLIGSMLAGVVGKEFEDHKLSFGAAGGYQLGGRSGDGPVSFSEFYGQRRGAETNPTRGIIRKKKH